MFIPGDIIIVGEIYVLVTCINSNGSIRGIDLTNILKCYNIEKSISNMYTHFINSKIEIEGNDLEKFKNLRLYKRLFLNTSDYYCREVCKIKSDCVNCPLNIRDVGKYFFIDDIVYYNKYKFTVNKVRLNLYGVHIDALIDALIDDSTRTVSSNFNELDYYVSIGKIYLDYELKYCSDLESTINFKRSDQIRLFLRRGYTIDPEDKEKYCILCINNNCKNCVYENKKRIFN